LDLSVLAAWWGAGIATLLLVWDIFKWLTSGPRLVFTASADWVMVIHGLGKTDATYISLTAANRGHIPATLSHVGLLYYKSHVKRLLRQPNEKFVVTQPGANFSGDLPVVLRPGEVWQGGIIQDEKIESMLSNGILESHLFHSASKWAVRAKVKLKRRAT
jgi:hypothetical protein